MATKITLRVHHDHSGGVVLPDREMNGMLQLTADERDWLAKHRQTLRNVFPGLIEGSVQCSLQHLRSQRIRFRR